MKWAKRSFLILLTALVFAVPIGFLIYLYKDDADLYRSKDYDSPQKLRESAQGLVDGLNTHDPARVRLFSIKSGTPQDAVEQAKLNRLIEAALPLPNCNYTLESVDDLGEQGNRVFAWGTVPTYRYDMHLTEQCPGKPQLSRLIGVISRATEGGHWTETLFVIEQ
ncbi:hypothetical protein ONA92_21085 [Mycobacteroides salmoniphilum]|uniref:hypothetical protein n=1 Tax=Mycobacteroides salmoniphilum TaxID=404941 RepID=UPI0035688B24